MHAARGVRGSEQDVCSLLRSRLDARREEIEAALLTRVFAIGDPSKVADPSYADALPAAVSAALDYGLEGVLRGREDSLTVPPVLLAQARLAARAGVTLDTVLLRYFSGYVLLADFLVEEAQLTELMRGSELKRLLRRQATLFERLVTSVTDEYGREGRSQPASPDRLRVECVERLLAGEPADSSILAYDFDRWHVAAIATGAGALDAIQRLADGLDCQLLLLPRDERSAWAWVGSRRRLDSGYLAHRAPTDMGLETAIGIGEPGRGLRGWRLTHRQATAILPLAQGGDKVVVRYADEALLASIHRDQLLSISLRELYLAPLEEERDGGQAARQTLRAYFTAGRNVSSAAVALGVNRNTVTNRLQAVEDRIGRPISACASELEAALGLEELGQLPGQAPFAIR